MSFLTQLSFTKKKHESGDIYTFSFTPKKEVKHSAGQHGLFILPGLYQPHPFSLSSAPDENYVTFTTHVETGSRFKQQLMKLKRGDKMTLAGPIMNFTLQPDETKYVFLAQGVGITPFRSMLVHAHTEKISAHTTLIHVDSHDHVFKSETHKLASKSLYPKNSKEFKYYINDTDSESLFYISGSPRFIRETKAYLLETGVSKNRIKTDSFFGY